MDAGTHPKAPPGYALEPNSTWSLSIEFWLIALSDLFSASSVRNPMPPLRPYPIVRATLSMTAWRRQRQGKLRIFSRICLTNSLGYARLLLFLPRSAFPPVRSREGVSARLEAGRVFIAHRAEAYDDTAQEEGTEAPECRKWPRRDEQSGEVIENK